MDFPQLQEICIAEHHIIAIVQYVPIMAKCCLSCLVCKKPFIQKLGDLILSMKFLIFSQFRYAMPLHLGAKPIPLKLSHIDMALFPGIIEYLGYSNLIFEFPDCINSPSSGTVFLNPTP